MDASSTGTTGRLANGSRILGIISFGLLVVTILFLVWIKFSTYDEFEKLALLGWVLIIFLGSFIVGIPGCIIAIIALGRNNAAENDPGIKRTALTGLVLSGLVVAFVGILLVYVFFFNSSNPPPPVPITPSSIIPLPNGD